MITPYNIIDSKGKPGEYVSTITIANSGSFDLATTLATSENIEFLGPTGTLTIESSAFENSTFATGGTTIISTGIGGGLINGFQSGDSIVVRDLATDYAIFDQSPDSAAQNGSVASDLSTLLFIEGLAHETEVITIAASGVVTDNLGLVTADISTYASEIEQALFGGHAQTADLFVTITADSADASLADATITSDGAIVICYLRGTRILTPAGERPVEALMPGDLVISHSGGVRPVKWIGKQVFNARFVANNAERLPVKIAAGALADNLPLRDLYVSPGHSLLLGGQLVLARDLINGVTITQPARNEDTFYYLIELDTHDCVIAEGVWAETYADAPGLRNQFHNTGDFYARFPDHLPPETQHLYAPRRESGPALAMALRPVLERANITPGLLRGYVDAIGDRIEGWAMDEDHPDFPVMVAIFAGSTRIGEALAYEYREDVAAAGLGSGRCMFSFPLPEDLPPEMRAQLYAVRAADGAELPLTPHCSEAARHAA